MLGAYFAYSVTEVLGFWPALVIAPLLVGVLGAGFEKYCLRRVHKFGHVPELLITFGLSYILLELVQLVWGRSSVDYRVPAELSGPLFTLYGNAVPDISRLHDVGGLADAAGGLVAADAHAHRIW